MSLLFDLGRKPPTTKMIALQVREHGAASLDEAQRRADEARYQEITCRSALNPVKGMPFAWTLNPYRGCTHGCHYCFARRYQTQFELGPGDEFSSLIFVKVNFPEVLRRELDRPTWTREQVALGTATDPYQPIEGHYKLTRRTLEALIAARTPVGIVTKGPMIVRDADLLVQLVTGRAMHGVPERADRGRGGVARAGTRHRSPAAAAARCPHPARRRRQRRRADGARRPRLHDAAGETRGDDQSLRGSRGRLRGSQPALSEGWHQGPFHGVPSALVPCHGRELRTSLPWRLRGARICRHRCAR